MWRAIVAAAIAAVAVPSVAQGPAPHPLALSDWSGLIFFCDVEPKFNVPADLCPGITAEAARQAAAAKIKFAALAPGDDDSGKAAKAKAAGFDDNAAIEMRVRLSPPHSPYRAAVVEIDALSRLHPVAQSVAGKPGMFRKIYTQGADPDAGPNWSKQALREVGLMIHGFFATYSAPDPR
jgi:hypothetical protein